MADLILQPTGEIVIGGETVKFGEKKRTSSGITQKIADVTTQLVEAGSTVTLWQSTQHAVDADPPGLPEQFKLMFIEADPDRLNASDVDVDIEITSTQNNSTTTRVMGGFRLNRNRPMLLSGSRVGDTLANVNSSTVYHHITRIQAINPNPAAAGANNVNVRLAILK